MISDKDDVKAAPHEVLKEPLYSGSQFDGILSKVRNNQASAKKRKHLKINWSRLKEATAVVADASAVAQLLGVGAILGSFGDKLIGLLSIIVPVL